ncbi:MAG: polysaccharide deacetylase family protein [Butyrivibrio sp.]|nr:polysaccharide deacetylase family protein [Butyrivibrio sp.]
MAEPQAGVRVQERNALRVIYYCFPGGKHKVLTMSYDDGRVEDRRLIEIFNQYGIRGTFNLNGLLIREDRVPIEEYSVLYDGHEVACHTALHPTVERCPSEQILRQTLEDREALESLMGYTIRGMAYPNGSVNDRVASLMRSAGIRYARTVVSTESFGMPGDYMHWNATCHHNNPRLMELGQQFCDLFKKQYTYMMYVWGHSYEFTDRDNWQVIEDFCKLMGGREDIWYATNIEIVDYMDAVERMQVSVAGDFAYNPSAIPVWMKVDEQIYECAPGTTTSF